MPWVTNKELKTQIFITYFKKKVYTSSSTIVPPPPKKTPKSTKHLIKTYKLCLTSEKNALNLNYTDTVVYSF